MAGTRKMRWAFAVTAILSLAIAIAWLFAPHLMLSLWSLQDKGAPTVYMARRFGGMFLGYGLLLWWTRNELPSPASFAICIASATMMGTSCILSAYGSMSGPCGTMGWTAAAIEGAGFCLFAALSVWVWQRLPNNQKNDALAVKPPRSDRLAAAEVRPDAP
jgi:hypothetical protein